MVTTMPRLSLFVLLAVFGGSALAFQAPDARVPLGELAAKAQDDAAAALALAEIYDQGRDVDPDPLQALAWRRRAADLGDVAAQFDLGLRYEHGWGAPRDSQASRYWLQRAADGGSGEARQALDRALLRDANPAPAGAIDAAATAKSESAAPEPRVVPAPESEQPHARRPSSTSSSTARIYDEPADGWAERHRPRLNLGWGIAGGSRHWRWSVWDGYADPWYANPWYPGVVVGSWYPFAWYDRGWAGHRHRHYRGRHEGSRGRVHSGVSVRH